ncbi:MAG: DNA-protecting protein DprA, partial [Pusillimonas sp.]
RGCHALIRQGAKLVESGQDIVEELQTNLPGSVTTSGQAATQRSTDLARIIPDDRVLQALGFDPVDVDTLLERTGLDIVQLNQHLTELELYGRIERLPDGRLQQQTLR